MSSGSSANSLAMPTCPAPEDFYEDTDLMALFMDGKTRGIVTDDLLPESATSRIAHERIRLAIQNATSPSGPVKPTPVQQVGDAEENVVEKLVKNDVALSAFLQKEYCYYEARYRYALRTFLEKAASRKSSEDAEANRLLQNAKRLNNRTNAALEIMNYIAQRRADNANIYTDAINLRNKKINENLDKLKGVYNILNRDNAIIRTQREMVRYTEEKNNYTTNQIAIWTGLNLLALATIFYVYRN